MSSTRRHSANHNSQNGPTVALIRSVEFASAHLYHQPLWSDGKNREHFGRCFTKHGHGHNYRLECRIEGPIDSESGMILNLTDFDRILNTVIAPLDHHHLNFDVPEFKTLVPTTENIALYCFQKIKEELRSFANVSLTRVRIFESATLAAEVCAGSIGISTGSSS